MCALTVTTTFNLAETITRELYSVLESRQKELLSLVGLLDFVTVMSVVTGERAAGRISAATEDVSHISNLASALGVYVYRSRFDWREQPDLVNGKVNHRICAIPRASHPDATTLLYFGGDRELAEGAEAAELTSRLQLVGRLYGYPNCCSRFFAAAGESYFDKNPRSVSCLGPFPSILNPLLPELYGFSLHFHFTCSPGCEPSRKAAQARLNSLSRSAPSARQIEDIGAGIAFYGPRLGAFLAREYERVSEKEYVLNRIVTRNPHSTRLFETTNKRAVVHLNSAHDFAIQDQRYQDPLHFAAIFTQSSSEGSISNVDQTERAIHSK